MPSTTSPLPLLTPTVLLLTWGQNAQVKPNPGSYLYLANVLFWPIQEAKVGPKQAEKQKMQNCPLILTTVLLENPNICFLL